MNNIVLFIIPGGKNYLCVRTSVINKIICLYIIIFIILIRIRVEYKSIIRDNDFAVPDVNLLGSVSNASVRGFSHLNLQRRLIDHLYHSVTVQECICADTCYTARYAYTRSAGTFTEGLVANTCNTIGNDDVGNRIASVERIRLDSGNTDAKRQIRNTIAIIECFFANARHLIRENKAR